MTQGTGLVLASGSPRRRDLMAEAGYDFTVWPPEVEEIADPALPVAEVVRCNAERKARDVAGRWPEAEAVVIGSDTLVALDGEAFGKPRDLDEAFWMLSRLVGRTHIVLTGVCVTRRADGQETGFIEETKVTFRALGPDEIRRYLSVIEPLDKAGSYAAQDHGELIIERIEGSWSNVVGLPMERLARVLAEFSA